MAAAAEGLGTSIGSPGQPADEDPAEIQEWLESLDGLVDHAGRPRARALLLRVLQRAREREVGLPGPFATDYVNTIAPGAEPEFPGDESIERRLRAYCRWNAAVMVHRAQRPDIGVGGHISTYASAAALYEVGFNHFFRGHAADGVAIRSSSKVTRRRASTPARSSKIGCQSGSSTASGCSARSHTPHTRRLLR